MHGSYRIYNLQQPVGNNSHPPSDSVSQDNYTAESCKITFTDNRYTAYTA